MSGPVPGADTPQPIVITEIPKNVAAYETMESRSSISQAEADFRRKLHFILSLAMLAATVVFTGIAAVLIYQAAVHGTADAQRLAFGLVGTVLGILWSQVTKLLDTATKR
jgi:hypothetical protein